MRLIHVENYFAPGSYVEGYSTLVSEWGRAGSARVRAQDWLPLALTT